MASKPAPKKPEPKGKGPTQEKGEQTRMSTAVATAAKAMDMTIIPPDSKNVPDYIKREDKRGTENLGMADLIIPRLEIVQGLSPAVKKGDPGFIPGATAGQLNNSVTRELYGEKVWLLPVDYSVQYLVWRDRKKAEAHNNANPRNKLPTDGGFFGAYPTLEEAKARAEEEGGETQCIFPVDTPTHLCLLMNKEKGQLEEIILPMPRTKAKISRQWNTMVKLAGGPRFGRAYEVGTVLQKNSQGDFYNFNIVLLGFPPKGMFERAEKLYDSLQKGERTVKMDTSGMASAGADAGDPAADAESRM